MSTLTVTDIRRTGETASRSTRGIAAAWVNFNGTGTVAIRDSQNVTSVTDNGTGDQRVNAASAMGDALYGVSVTGLSTVAAGANGSAMVKGVTATGPSDKTTSGVSVIVGFSNTAATADTADVNVTIHGDLA